jgi:Tfp pilus assembly protein PilE
VTDERGYLLVEMTVTLAILVIVLAVGSAFFFFCSRTYSEGGKKTIVQSNARLAANFITKEVRYADKISTNSFNTCHCLKLEDNTLTEIIKKDGVIQSTREITRDSCLTDLSFRLESDDHGKAVLFFIITGGDEMLRNDFKIESEVLLVNIRDLNGVTLEGSEIFFTKPTVEE